MRMLRIARDKVRSEQSGKMPAWQEFQGDKEVTGMKRWMVLMVAVVFLFSGMAFAAEVKDKSGKAVKDRTGAPVQSKDAPKAAPPKAATMKATGTVQAISPNALKLGSEGKTLDFFLVKVFPSIKAGDKVKVTYTVKDGKNVASRVTKVKEPKKKEPAKKKAAPTIPVKDKTGKEVKDKTGKPVQSKQ